MGGGGIEHSFREGVAALGVDRSAIEHRLSAARADPSLLQDASRKGRGRVEVGDTGRGFVRE